VKAYGKPLTVSNNGRIFIFKKSTSLILNILMLTLDGFDFIKSVDIMDNIVKYVEKESKHSHILLQAKLKLTQKIGQEKNFKKSKDAIEYE